MLNNKRINGLEDKPLYPKDDVEAVKCNHQHLKIIIKKKKLVENNCIVIINVKPRKSHNGNMYMAI